MQRRPKLSLNEWAVLGVLADAPTHGYDIASALGPDTPIGDAWRLNRQLVYRALERLEALGLVEPRRTEPGDAGPPRTIYGITRRGRSELRTWLDTPVEHLRDVRGALLLKLVVLEHLGLPHTALVHAQLDAFEHLLEERQATPRPDDVIATWRHHSANAIAAFLHDIAHERAPT
jgi:DNA-binding PadR family transcriptional regulator